MCIICSSKPDRSLVQTNGDRDFISKVNQAWSELVACLNNDPTANRCTAIDHPLPLPAEPDIKKDITKRFLEVMSKTADLALSYESHSYPKITKHLQIDITLDSNSIYLSRFLDLYSEDLIDCGFDLRSQMLCRTKLNLR